jgi:hypothetical protein
MKTSCLRKSFVNLAVFCILAMVIAPACLGDMVSIGSSRDNTLYETADGSLSNGAGQHFFAGETALAELRRGLLYFDIASAIPNGATITDVTLTLNMSRTIVGDTNVGLHSALADWGEGTSDASGQEGGGAPASPGDATWIHTFSPGSLWATAGGDFDPVATATTIVGGNGFYNWTSAAMISEIQSWLDNPGSNFGWVVVGEELGTVSAKRFDTRENPIAQNRPVLQIQFTAAIPEPGSFLVCAVASVALGITRRRKP